MLLNPHKILHFICFLLLISSLSSLCSGSRYCMILLPLKICFKVQNVLYLAWKECIVCPCYLQSTDTSHPINWCCCWVQLKLLAVHASVAFRVDGRWQGWGWGGGTEVYTRNRESIYFTLRFLFFSLVLWSFAISSTYTKACYNSQNRSSVIM